MKSNSWLAFAFMGLAGAAIAAAPKADKKTEAGGDAFWARYAEVAQGAQRSAENKARDQYRHPKETLEFFGLKAGQTVLEITPGGGWYTEILGPLMKGQGKLTAAIVDPSSLEKESTRDYYKNNNKKYRDKLAADAASYDQVEVMEFNLNEPKFGPGGTYDLVMTFRNVHNWVSSKADAAMFKGFYAALKPGGVLGVEEHRAKQGATMEETFKSGYLPEDYVIKLATDAGFKLDKKSEVNANPKDTKDYAEGVWTLPPSLTLKDKDRDKYLAIGESDRMTLRFVKPASTK
jgi:predicted methyltransferase